MTTLPVAAIDLGTNTARLLIARRQSDGSMDHLLVRRIITRLGGGFTRERGISPEARKRSVTAMVDFADEIARHGVARIRAVATSAVRDAVNGRDFCDEIKVRSGIDLEIIDGDTEAVLTLSGVLSGLSATPDQLLLFDVGGGSTEFTMAEGNKPLFTRSLPLGVVRLTEGKVSLQAMEEKIVRELRTVTEDLRKAGLFPIKPSTVLVATAGTATTLAAISLKLTEYDYRKVNNHILSLEEIRAIFSNLLPMEPHQRLQVPGLEKGREDLIIAGTLLTVRTMELFSIESLTVSDFGLLEGVLLEAMAQHSKTEVAV